MNGSRYNRHFGVNFAPINQSESKPIRPPDDALSTMLKLAQGLAPAAGTAIGGIVGGPVGAGIGGAIGAGVGGLAGFGESEREKPYLEAEQDREARERERQARDEIAGRIVQGL